MRLKEKQFVPFIVGVALLSVIVIVFSSFRFKQKQERMFAENLQKSKLLQSTMMYKVGSPDSLTLSSLKGKNALLVFWASWSDKSELMLNEIDLLASERDSLVVLAGLVKDAEESFSSVKKYKGFVYVDGTYLFNELKVPGIPSYVLFNKDGTVMHSNIGYQKGVGYDTLKARLNE
ncbi:MAG: hypothetical protein FH748_08405 [Balneolaceae bacterium]|nr:hypothetical protein [Balneolaceae bacterium]